MTGEASGTCAVSEDVLMGSENVIRVAFVCADALYIVCRSSVTMANAVVALRRAFVRKVLTPPSALSTLPIPHPAGTQYVGGLLRLPDKKGSIAQKQQQRGEPPVLCTTPQY